MHLRLPLQSFWNIQDLFNNNVDLLFAMTIDLSILVSCPDPWLPFFPRGAFSSVGIIQSMGNGSVRIV